VAVDSKRSKRSPRISCNTTWTTGLLSTPRKLKKLGDLIKEQTVEYRLADELYTGLEWAELVLSFKLFGAVGFSRPASTAARNSLKKSPL
jgi:hypothetical protein